MEPSVYQVNAFGDEAAAVWVATSEDVPGLATEANTIEALSQKLRDIIPDLLFSNHIPIHAVVTTAPTIATSAQTVPTSTSAVITSV